VDVQNRVNQALGRLPNEVKNTGIIITKQIGGFVFGAESIPIRAVRQPVPQQLYDVYVKDALKRVKELATRSFSASANMPCACGSIRRNWRSAD